MYPDERHYSYAASRMIETGDWLIPRTPSGEVRLRKPIIPYWLSAAGFKTVGVSVLGSRLLWLFCALGVLALTYALSRALGVSEKGSLLALFLVGGNPLFIRASVNAIPDMPLTFFLLASVLGFTRIFRDDNPLRRFVWLAWLGAGLAVLAKGILPLVFLAVVVTSALLFARDRLRYLLAPAPILVAVGLVAAWYLYAILSHPDAFYAEFIGDQLTQKVARNPFDVPLAIPIYMSIGVASFFFLPVVLAAVGRSKKLGDLPPAVKMLGLWVIAVPIAFSPGGFLSDRYLLPAVPVLAALLALGFSRLDPTGRVLTRASRLVLTFVLTIEVVILVLYLGIEFQIAPLGEAVVVSVLALTVVAVLLHAVWTGRRAAYLLPASVLVVAAMSIFPLRHLVLPHPGGLLAERLAASATDPARAFLTGDSELAAAVRLHSPRADTFIHIKNLDLVETGGPCVVMTEKKRHALKLQERGFHVETVKGGWRLIDPARLLKAVWEGRLAEERAASSALAFFATCP